MCGAVGWPRILSGAEKPNRIGGEARRLGRTRNQDRRILRFRCEKSFVHSAIEDCQEFLPLNRPAIETERRAVVDGLLPAATGLEFGARKRTHAGPVGKFEQFGYEFSRGDCRLRPACEFLKAALSLRDASNPRGGRWGSRFL